MKTLITDAFDGEHPDDIDAEYEALVAEYRKDYEALNERLFTDLTQLLRNNS